MTTARKIKLGALVLILGIITIITLQNTQQVTTTLLWVNIQMPLALMLFTTFLFGVIGGFVLAYFRSNKHQS